MAPTPDHPHLGVPETLDPSNPHRAAVRNLRKKLSSIDALIEQGGELDEGQRRKVERRGEVADSLREAEVNYLSWSDQEGRFARPTPPATPPSCRRPQRPQQDSPSKQKQRKKGKAKEEADVEDGKAQEESSWTVVAKHQERPTPTAPPKAEATPPSEPPKRETRHLDLSGIPPISRHRAELDRVFRRELTRRKQVESVRRTVKPGDAVTVANVDVVRYLMGPHWEPHIEELCGRQGTAVRESGPSMVYLRFPPTSPEAFPVYMSFPINALEEV